MSIENDSALVIFCQGGTLLKYSNKNQCQDIYNQGADYAKEILKEEINIDK
jgi:hypothetical protein